MTGRQQNATGSFPQPNDMAGRRSAEDAILSYQELLDTIRRTNLCDQLHNFWVIEASIPADDQEAALCAFWDS